MDVLTGSSGTDKLTGADLSATFELDGTDRYITGTRQASFSAFDGSTAVQLTTPSKLAAHAPMT
jgi:hypothetical protein